MKNTQANNWEWYVFSSCIWTPRSLEILRLHIFLVITSVQLAGHGEKCLFDCHCVKLIIETQFEDIFRIVLLHKINSH